MSNCAKLNTANSFTGNQTINGYLNVYGTYIYHLLSTLGTSGNLYYYIGKSTSSGQCLRIRYYYNGVEIDIDTWPMIPTYMELEADSVEKIKELEDILEVDKSKITTLFADEIYEKYYGIDVLSIKELRFKEE